MRKVFLPVSISLAALLGFLGLLAACRHEPPNLHSPGSTIVVLGDSIASGYGVGEGEAFPEVVGAKLKTEVINAGVPGDTTGDGLARLDQVLAQDPWLVVVELGGNDILRQVPPEQAEQNLRRILDRLLAAKVLPVLIEVDAPFAGRYNAMYDRLADDYHIPIVDDVLGEILRSPSLKSDQVHPNAQGQRELADAVAKELEPLIAARKKRR
ncbi:MAG TPA: arylesterase [Thermoanaerobaculia bacterium]|nr:arylesterase [Thermoanaerobaculia bacterium]